MANIVLLVWTLEAISDDDAESLMTCQIGRMEGPDERVNQTSFIVEIETIPDTVLHCVSPMTKQPSTRTRPSRHPPNPKIQFRVLIIGRANAGKTTILQRVCDTTQSPTIHRRDRGGRRKEVCRSSLTVLRFSSYATQVKLDPSTEVSDKTCCLLSPLSNPEPAWRARYRRRASVLQPQGLCLPRFAWYRVRWY